jgi:beta-N-acetylhexosaminidase
MPCKNAAIREQIQNEVLSRLKKSIILLGAWLFWQPVDAQDRKNIWVDSVLQTLSLPEKIGQLFMVPVPANLNATQATALAAKVKTFGIGGIYITRGGPVSEARLANHLQKVTKIPLLVGLDAGSGLAQTLDSTTWFPKPQALGAIVNDSLLYALGERIAAEMKILGLHVNFAPRTDRERSHFVYENYFSDQDQRVADKCIALVRGLQDHGVIACAAQLPAPAKPNLLPDSTLAADLSLPDTLGLYPTARLVQNGVGGLLTTFFNFTLSENKKKVPAAISPVFIGDILKKKLGFEGVAFTRIGDLQRISGKQKSGEVEWIAFTAGNDMLISSNPLGIAIKKIAKNIGKNKAWLERLNASVRRILTAKYRAGLAAYRPADLDNLKLRLNPPEDALLRQQLVEASVTVVSNSHHAVPVATLNGKRFAALSLGQDAQNEFTRYLAKYADVKPVSFRSLSDTVGLADKLGLADVVIVASFPQGGPFLPGIVALLRRLSATKEIILCHFGDPRLLATAVDLPTVMMAYSTDLVVQQVAAQIIFGAVGATGVLPVSVGNQWAAGTGIPTPACDRLGYSLPEAEGMDSRTLEQITSIAAEAIALKATPGCHVLVARKGKVVYEKSFGYYTYDNKTAVSDETLYDLASVTKVSATLQTVMYMYEKGLIDVNKKASSYLPELKTSNKKDFTIKDILTHQAGLWPFLPFWAETVKDSTLWPQYYSHTRSDDYPFPVASELFASRSMKDSLWHWIINARVRDKTGRVPFDYRYSDMGFYILQHLAEKMLGQPMEDFLREHLYDPLGAYTTGYLPLRKFQAERIAPTENDRTFRRSLLIGYVHDQGAAMHGGIAGHAGLFSTANDLAKLGQMWLQKGHYGGQQYFKPETIEFFTQKQYETSRRGLGWDKPTQSDPNGPTSLLASPRTFGHTGFTGISIWVDPEFDLVFIFFSNRVYPDMTNNKILNANIRPRIQDVVYKSIFAYCEKHRF